MDDYPVLDYTHGAVYQVTVTDEDARSTDYYCNESFTLPDAPEETKIGYSFSWSDGKGNNYAASKTVTIIADTTFTAQWTANTYTVKFDGNGSDGGTMSSQAFTYDTAQTLMANTFTRTGYTFAGWNTKADGSGISYEDREELTLTDNLTLYAQWKAKTSSGGSSNYTITVSDSDNGAVTSSISSASAGTTVTLTVAPDKGYELDSLTVTDARGNAVIVTKVSDTQYTFVMPSGGATVTAAFQQLPLPLTDVKDSAWYYDAVHYAYFNGIMVGTSETTFAPNGTLTRAMVVQILYNLEGQPAVIGKNTFTDTTGHWAAKAIAWAQQTDVVSGYEDGTFRPEKAVTREELAQMLYNYAQYKDYDLTATGDLSQFSDGDKVQDWAEEAMAWANGNGLINGYDDGTLEPGGNATRVQAASILMNFDLNLVEE